MTRSFAFAAVAAALVSPGGAHAQPLGSFSWQLQPFCNVVTVNLTQQGAVYTVILSVGGMAFADCTVRIDEARFSVHANRHQ